MKKIGIFSFIISLCLVLGSGENAKHYPLPTLSFPQILSIIDQASGERALNDIRHLSLIHRWFNSDGYDEAAAYIQEKAQDIGLVQVDVEKFPADGKILYSTHRTLPRWNVKEAELAMISPRHKHLVSWDETPTSLASNSRSADVEAELIDVGEGVSSSDYEGKDVKGKLVLAASPQGKGRIDLVHRLAVLDRGAIGVVSYRSYYLDDFPDLITWDHIWELEKNGKTSTFGFCISKRMGRELQRLLKSGEKVVLRARVESTIGPGEYRLIKGSIPGTEFPDQEIWFIAHLDHANPGANDNASGSAAILECARAFLDLVNSGRLPKPKRTLRFFWVPEVYGPYAYLSTHPEEANKIVAVINMDMVGEDQKLCGSTFQVTQTPDSTPSFFNDLLAAHLDFLLGETPLPGHEALNSMAIVSALGTREPWQAKVTPYAGGSDHEVFLGGGVNIPATMFGSWPDYYYHTAQDTPDKCDSTQLKRAIALGMLVASSVANIDLESGIEFADILYSRSLQRLGRETERAIEFLQDGAPQAEDLKEALNIIDSGIRREKGTLLSLKRLLLHENRLDASIRLKIESLSSRMASDQKYIGDYFNTLCFQRGLRPGITALTAEEKRASLIVPHRDAAFPGPFEDGYIAAKLEAKGIPYSNPFSELANFEIGAFIDGKRSALEIRNAVSAECGPVKLAEVIEYLNRLESAGVIVLKRM
jgi:aminopeptidase YwaD